MSNEKRVSTLDLIPEPDGMYRFHAVMRPEDGEVFDRAIDRMKRVLPRAANATDEQHAADALAAIIDRYFAAFPHGRSKGGADLRSSKEATLAERQASVFVDIMRWYCEDQSV